MSLVRCNFPYQLTAVPAFAHLRPDAQAALLSSAHTYRLKTGDVLLHQGDPISAFYIIHSGGMRLVSYAEDGQVVTLKVYGAGDVFGLLAISGSYPHPTQIEAIQDSVIIAVDGHDARALMLDYPELALTIIDLLTAHVHEGHERVRHMATKRVDRRLAQSLLKLADKFGREEGSHVTIDLPLTQRDLAEFTGTTVETINRTLTVWEKQGIVACSHKHITILSLCTLEAFLEAPYLSQVDTA